MNILGVDPGTRVAGFSIIQTNGPLGGKVSLKEAGCLILPVGDLMQIRLRKIYIFLDETIVKNKIDKIAIETPFLGKNAQNFLKLGYVRGIIYLLADKHGLNINEYAPTEVKKAITGSGSAAKDQVCRVVKALFPEIAAVSMRYDVTDAIAVAFCGALQ